MLIEKQYIELGYIDKIDIRLLKMKNLSGNEPTFGIRLEYLPGNEVITNVRIGFIDSDEIDACIKALELIQNEIVKQEVEVQTEVTLLTRAGVILGCFYDLPKNKWIPYIQIKQGDPRSTVRLNDDNLITFKQILLTAKTNYQTQ